MFLNFYQFTPWRCVGLRLVRMKTEIIHLNLLLAWLWILLGFVSGMVLGMFFHAEGWLGGYASFKRRMYRLAHISFFGLGAVNLLFWLTVKKFSPAGSLIHIASVAFIVGALTMPVCCVVMAHAPKAHLIFTVPVVSLILGGALMLALLLQNSKFPGTANTSVWLEVPAFDGGTVQPAAETLRTRSCAEGKKSWMTYERTRTNEATSASLCVLSVSVLSLNHVLSRRSNLKQLLT